MAYGVIQCFHDYLIFISVVESTFDIRTTDYSRLIKNPKKNRLLFATNRRFFSNSNHINWNYSQVVETLDCLIFLELFKRYKHIFIITNFNKIKRTFFNNEITKIIIFFLEANFPMKYDPSCPCVLWLFGWSVGRSVMIFLKEGKSHFHRSYWSTYCVH